MARLRLTVDRQANTAYLHVGPEVQPRAIQHTVVCDAGSCGMRGKLILESNKNRKLLGISFEDAKALLFPELLRQRDRMVNLRFTRASRVGYLYFAPQQISATHMVWDEEKHTAGIVVDFDRNGRVLGIEFLSTRRLPSELLHQGEPLDCIP